MGYKNILNSKTTLEYLVMINEQSYSGIGRELNITPQQFSDWIKKRRPIPQERLKTLCDYFGIDEYYLVDEKNFTKNLDSITKIDIQMLLIKKRINEGMEEEYFHLQELQKEKIKQIRIARLASILHHDNEEIDQRIDRFLEEMEQLMRGRE